MPKKKSLLDNAYIVMVIVVAIYVIIFLATAVGVYLLANVYHYSGLTLWQFSLLIGLIIPIAIIVLGS